MTSPSSSATVADLMSRGAQTLDPAAALSSVVRKMRLIGHEGYPVVENGRVVGLLTRRDADRALEHGLGHLLVRDVMLSGAVALQPVDPVSLLERRMVESGWGQIPVVADDGTIIGIVTRTDLIRYWANQHPATTAAKAESLDANTVASVLGQPIAHLIEQIAQQARDQGLNLYLVGGIVRDLLLQRPNSDIDFVVEGDAIRFAEGLQARFGGQIHSYRPFGTATWIIGGAGIEQSGLPDHVDFATARSEFYEHPTALPTVYTSSIRRDLYRRDFTINTLAVQWSPAQASGRILDEYGGIADLRARLIRVLHSLSFVDDPTRILRAVRFEQRLGFQIEPRTAQLIDTALPMLRRVTGERLRNELTLLLGEANPADSFLLLRQRGILSAIHPAFVVPLDLSARFERARILPWIRDAHDSIDLSWCILLADIPVADLPDLCTRLLFAKNLADAVLATARLVQNLGSLTDPDLPPSRIAARLDGLDSLALHAAFITLDNGFSIVRERIQRYANEWCAVRPVIDGHTLRARGLKPGPCYARILTRLRNARLDGEVTTDGEESRLLDALIEEGICDDGAE
ncbi:MAG: CBS domain-containing protein [Chloroflexi bacterium]|nr:CBS domain-containing protein [Chloroflexota bacterium]